MYEALKLLREKQVTEGVLELSNGWIVDVEITNHDTGLKNYFGNTTNLAIKTRV
jgi:hypothetical protein